MQVCEAAEALARAQADDPVITVRGAGWHPGVIGIVAGRIKERFGRPAIVIAEVEDGTGTGSGRSISGVSPSKTNEWTMRTLSRPAVK